MNRNDIHGRTVNARATKSLKDASTRRPMDRGIIVDLEVFDNRVPPLLLQDIVAGKRTNVSIGFSFDADRTPGVVEDEEDKSIMGAEYDYVQRNIAIDHTAFGLEQGRCPMPLCGIGADEIKVAIDPFAGYPDFESCIKDIMKQNPSYTREQAAATCAMIEKRSKEKRKGDAPRTEAERAMAHFNISEEKWEQLSEEEKQEYISKLPKRGSADMKQKIDEFKAKITEVLSSLDELIEEEVSEDYPSSEYSLPTSCICRECGYILMESPTVSIEKHCSEYKCPNCGAEQMYQRNSPESGEEIVKGDEWKELFEKLPENVKQVIVDAGLCPGCDEPEVSTDEWDLWVDAWIAENVGEDAVLSYAQKKARPDSDYAYIESGCKKEDGKTEQRCRHFLIHDPAHVRAALAALMGARTGKKPEFADEAKPKICAAAKKFKIESEVCGTKKKKGDALVPDEVMAKFDRTLEDPDLKRKLREVAV